MWKLLVALGFAVALLGSALVFVQFPTWYPPWTFSSDQTVSFGENVSAPAIAGGVNQRIEFTAVSTTSGPGNASRDSWRLYDCGVNRTCNASVFQGHPKIEAIGLGGSVSWSAAPGQLFQVAPGGMAPNTSVTITVSYSEPILGGLLGVGLVIGGAGLFLAGVALPGKGRPPSYENPTLP